MNRTCLLTGVHGLIKPQAWRLILWFFYSTWWQTLDWKILFDLTLLNKYIRSWGFLTFWPLEKWYQTEIWWWWWWWLDDVDGDDDNDEEKVDDKDNNNNDNIKKICSTLCNGESSGGEAVPVPSPFVVTSQIQAPRVRIKEHPPPPTHLPIYQCVCFPAITFALHLGKSPQR